MRILSYNCRGLGKKRAVKSLDSLMKRVTPQLVFLMETKQTKEENESTRRELGFEEGDSWSTDHSHGGRAGGISHWWKEGMNVIIMSLSFNHIDARVVEDNGFVWRFSGVYGWPETQDKYKTWEVIDRLTEQWTGAWLCGGDFNQVLSPTEKDVGRAVVDHEMNDFQSCLTDAGLQDLGFNGHQFTWENRRVGGRFIEERLDRFTASDDWRATFPQARVTHLAKERSDNRPMLCDTKGEEDEEPRWGRSFHFDPFWSRHEDCRRTIEEAWGQPNQGDCLTKLLFCRSHLEQWSRRAFPNFHKQKARIRRALEALGRVERTQIIADQIIQLEQEMDEVESNEESY
ncbi:unnamed protein product [Linum trigynum]|uniref:Endonuclease/exonuclease/phosphatase domain-containing protein n=1 Tax=Linum trigynum TaxID=586398 RepID=A0AAV2CF83_9ROSI